MPLTWMDCGEFEASSVIEMMRRPLAGGERCEGHGDHATDVGGVGTAALIRHAEIAGIIAT